MENGSRARLLDAALELLGQFGASSLTVRAIEDAVGLPHGSVRHHFGNRVGLVAALFDHLAEIESDAAPVDVTSALERLIGPGRSLSLARYELFLMAARDPALRAPVVRARNHFVDAAAERVGEAAAPGVVAALDGLVLDALVRGRHDPAQLRSAVARIIGPGPTGPERLTRSAGRRPPAAQAVGVSKPSQDHRGMARPSGTPGSSSA